MDLGCETKANIHFIQNMVKVSKGGKIRNRYNQELHLTQDTNGRSDKLTVGHHKRELRVQPFPGR